MKAWCLGKAGPLPSVGLQSRQPGLIYRCCRKWSGGGVSSPQQRGRRAPKLCAIAWGRPQRGGGGKLGRPLARLSRAPPPGRLTRPSPLPPTRHSRFCCAKGRCVVVQTRKHSFPMSQSSNPGTWPWRLVQKSRHWNFRSTFREKRESPARSGRVGETEAKSFEPLPQIPAL